MGLLDGHTATSIFLYTKSPEKFTATPCFYSVIYLLLCKRFYHCF